MSRNSSVFEGTNGPFRDLTDYILGITHEIWESRHVERIDEYYSRDCLIYTLGGMVHGANAIIENTRATLQSFPDRLLLGEAVVGSRLGPGQFLSSHRIGSPMTHFGDLPYCKATGRKVFVRTIADCLVENGKITKEWLVRDNYSLACQLGVDALLVARRMADAQTAETCLWLNQERNRVSASAPFYGSGEFDAVNAFEFAASVIGRQWGSIGQSTLRSYYAPYAVVYDSQPLASGIESIEQYYHTLRSGVADVTSSIDHVGVMDRGGDEYQVAARWSVALEHAGDLWGLPSSGRRALILGVTHWQIVAGRIVAEWSIYDRVAVLAQLV
jgi:predicted ester cyclase